MNEFLDSYICNYLGVTSLSEEVFSSTKNLFIDDNIDLTGINKFINLNELTLSHMIITHDEISNILKLNNLKKLNILNSNITLLSELSKSLIEELYILGSKIDDVRYINNFKNLKVLSLTNCDEIDLDNLSIIRKLNKLYLDGTKVTNTDLLFYMNNCTLIGLSYTDINDISLLCSLENLKTVYIDDVIFKNNIPIVGELKLKGVTVNVIGGPNEIL